MKQRERETREMVYQGRVRRRDKKKGRKEQPVCEGIRLDGPAQPCPGKPAGSRRFTAPAPDRCSLAVCDPESSMASRNPQAPPSKPDVQGRLGQQRLAWPPGELQRLAEEITSSLLARESPGDGAGQALHKQETPVGEGGGAC